MTDDTTTPDQPVHTSAQAFDVDSWISQGESALSEIEHQESELELRLGVLRRQRHAILEALGRSKVAEASEDAPHKVMIRPLLKEVLVEADGHGLSLDEIVDLVQTKQPRARRQSIEVSLHRLTRRHERIEEYEVAEGATHWKMVLDHDTTIIPDASEQSAAAAL